ncbi:MAG: Fic family protein [Kiritimatiellae bacterium]|nr:Fic family protein [Kiritimatiellia bacterium]
MRRNHPFVDGNKRIAIAAAELFLVVNGVRLDADDQLLKPFTLAVAEGAVEIEEVRICYPRYRTRQFAYHRESCGGGSWPGFRSCMALNSGMSGRISRSQMSSTSSKVSGLWVGFVLP